MSLRNQLASVGVSDVVSEEATRIAASLAALLSGIPSQQSRRAVLAFILAECFRQTQGPEGVGGQPIDPQLLDWASRTVDPQEAANNLREIRETGGVRLADFDAELDQLARG